ncbi:hypothetical protein H2201_005503 [Coniosporium apollinis]|uniref:Uncharacterized protein n=1 Tax=Coniosporium apollinis TaxID=61459 RepID=A0ABQ9NTS2_9PEZI|nr:hypothetical protein H2201_005503 [Coniosporium apollinis]
MESIEELRAESLRLVLMAGWLGTRCDNLKRENKAKDERITVLVERVCVLEAEKSADRQRIQSALAEVSALQQAQCDEAMRRLKETEDRFNKRWPMTRKEDDEL